jgi:lysine N6-hydroxylase
VDGTVAAESGSHYFCIGVGIGPSNLSLASLLYTRPDLPSLFLDKKPQFTWHDGQQIPGATLQVSTVKDLVSLADPTNEFSFLHYLHSTGRIYHYLNSQFEAVPRQEFRNYLKWASDRNPNLAFGEEVVSIDFDEVFRVKTSRRELTASNLSVGVGTRPWTPPQVGALGERSFHVSDFLEKAADLAGLRVAVVGGGQSGAEAFLDLMSRSAAELPRRISWISRRPNFLPIDDSPFTNDWYMPDHSDYFAGLPGPARSDFNVRNVLTSDGISGSTLQTIYQRMYVYRFVDEMPDLLVLYPNREVATVTGDDASGYELTVQHHYPWEGFETIEVDAVVWATGYRTADMRFLGPLGPRMARQEGEYKIDDSFAACWDGPPGRNIFLHNAARQQRGLADPNLSLLAWRSKRVFDRMTGTRTVPQLRSFIEWAAIPAPRSNPLTTFTEDRIQPMTDFNAGHLASVRMFASLDASELQVLSAATEVERVPAGKEIVSEGEISDDFYLIVTGVASVLRGGRFVATLSSGSHFGEIAVFDRGPRTATVVADTDCELLVVSHDRMMRAIEEAPTIAQKLLAGMAAQLREVAAHGAYWGSVRAFGG